MTAARNRSEPNGKQRDAADFRPLIRTPVAACPQLLVSVRSVEEAVQALAGGADILDIKEPSRGSLGMASVEMIADIGAMSAVTEAGVAVSAALGELDEWRGALDLPPLPWGLRFAKLGLSRCGDRSDWVSEWVEIRREFQQHAASRINWVAVAYADHIDAAAPAVEQVLHAAIETDCAGLLIDTWTKDGRTLVDSLQHDELARIADQCHQAGLFLALAGRISHTVLPQIAAIPAEIIAIRSAACRNHDRVSPVDAACVSQFKLELQSHSPSTASRSGARVAPLPQRR